MIRTPISTASSFLNAGTQTVIDLANPAGFDLDQFNQEFSVNFTSLIALTNGFLPFLQKKDTPTSVVLYVHLPNIIKTQITDIS